MVMLKKYKTSFIFFSLLYVLFFVKPWSSITGFIYSHDDVVYYAQTVSFVNDFDADIKNNLGPFGGKDWKIGLDKDSLTGKVMYFQPVGPSLLYIAPYLITQPIVYLISLFRGTIFNTYDPLFFVVLSLFTLFLFYLSGAYLKKTIMLFSSEEIADITATFVLWGTILPVYVFRRPIFSVIPEFFLVTYLFYWFMKSKKGGKLSIFDTVISGLLCCAVIITRWNDIHLILFSLFMIFSIINRPLRHKLFALVVFLIIVFLSFILTQGLVWYSNFGSINKFIMFYKGLTERHFGLSHIATGWPVNLFYIIFGLDWGIIFTMPILVIGGLAFIGYSHSLFVRNKLISLFIALFIFMSPFFIILKWRSTGGFYGYRFLVSLLPLAALGFALLVKNRILNSKIINMRIVTNFIIIFCLFNFFIILPFEYADTTTLRVGYLTLGGYGWQNNSYFINAILFYFHSSIIPLIGIFSRGYLAASVFGILSALGVDLARFGPKVSTYFPLVGYKGCVAIVYFVLMSFGLFFLSKKRR